MKQVININFQGRVVPIEVTAFDILKDYTESLNRYFAQEEGKEEIGESYGKISTSTVMMTSMPSLKVWAGLKILKQTRQQLMP